MNETTVNANPSFLARLLAPLFAIFRWFFKHPVILVLLILVLGGAYYYLMPSQNGQITVAPRLSEVTIGDVENTVTAAGKLAPKESVDVGAQVSGQLEKLYVEVGDVVTKGQLLAEIDASVQRAKVDASRASLTALKAQVPSRESSLKLARLNADRQARMMAEDATSQQEYDNAQTNLVQAEASLAQLQAQIIQSEASLSQEEATLGYTKIYAPMDGTVIDISAKEGQTLNANQQAPTILTVADLTVMTVETEVSEADIGKLKKDMEVYFTTLGGGDRRWFSEVRQVLPTPATSNNVVLYTALFDIDNADGTLLTDMTAQVFFVESAARNVVTVPVGALTYISEQIAAGNSDAPVAAGQQGNMQGGRQMGNLPGMSAADLQSMTQEQRQQMRQQMQARMAENGGQFPATGQRQTQSNQSTSSAQKTGPKLATVQRYVSEGKYETVQVHIGVTSRITAEVLSGLKPGDQVVAGVVQQGQVTANQQDRNEGPGFRMMGGF